MSDEPTRPRRKKRRPKPVADESAPARPEEVEPAEAKPPRVILAGAATAAAGGLALVGIDQSEIGRWLSLGGLLLLIYGIHTFGRLGEDEGPAR